MIKTKLFMWENEPRLVTNCSTKIKKYKVLSLGEAEDRGQKVACKSQRHCKVY